MKILSTIVATLAIAGLLVLAVPQRTFAACKPDGSEIETSFAWGGKKCFPKKNADGSLNNPIYIALLAIFNFLAIGVGVVVVGGITFGAIRYITSNGNSQQAQQGVMVIVNSVIGLLLFIFMYALLNFLVPGGLFR